MSKGKFQSHIERPTRRTTARGGSYITPFDLIRSKRGREVVDTHARMSENGQATNTKEDAGSSESSRNK